MVRRYNRNFSMRQTVLVFLTVLSFFFTQFALAADPRLSPQVQKDFDRLLKGVEKFELSNGLRVLMYRRGQAPVFSGQIWVKVGGVNEVPGTSGVAHMLEHMAFKGSQTIGTKDFQKEKALLDRVDELMREQPLNEQELHKVSAQLQQMWESNEFSRLYAERGASGLNAGTAKDFTFYMVLMPTVGFEFWCWMESDRLLNPVFRQFYKERDVVGEERRMSIDDSPEGLVYEALLSTAYWNHPYQLPIVGWATDIARLTRQDIEELYAKFYRPDNMVISLVGDLDPEQARPLIEKYFGRLPRATGDLPSVKAIEKPQNGERQVTVHFDAKPVFMMGYHKPVFPNKDDAYFSVLHSLLSDGRSSILHRELVRERKLAVDVGTSEAPGELYPSLFFVSAVPRENVSSEYLRDEIQKIFDRLGTTLVSEEDLAAAKRRVRKGLLDGLDSSYGLSKELAHSELLWGDWRAFISLYDTIFETSAEDVRRLAQRYLKTTNRTFVQLKKPIAEQK